MFDIKNIISLVTSFIGGSSVQIYIYLALAIGGFGAGYYVEHLRFANYQERVESIAKEQEEHNKSIEKQHQLVNQSIKEEYDAKLSLLRNYYANGVRQPSSRTASNISTTTSIADATARYNLLASQCSEVTLQTLELQKWIAQQVGIANE